MIQLSGGDYTTLHYYEVSEGNAESVMTGRRGVLICKVSSCCEELSLLVTVGVVVSLVVLLVTLCSAAAIDTAVVDVTIVTSKMNVKIKLDKVKGFYLFQIQHLPLQNGY